LPLNNGLFFDGHVQISLMLLLTGYQKLDQLRRIDEG